VAACGLPFHIVGGDSFRGTLRALPGFPAAQAFEPSHAKSRESDDLLPKFPEWRPRPNAHQRFPMAGRRAIRISVERAACIAGSAHRAATSFPALGHAWQRAAFRLASGGNNPIGSASLAGSQTFGKDSLPADKPSVASRSFFCRFCVPHRLCRFLNS
jgi:hypothetical protein